MRGRESKRDSRQGTRYRRRAQSSRFFEHSRIRDSTRRHDYQNQKRGVQRCWGFDWKIYNQATPFYFTNFPEDWSYEQMWRTFLKYGRVYAIYSPRRTNKEGKRFGFVRFLEVKNVNMLEKQLDQIRIGDHKLRVNCPRFSEAEKSTRKPIVQSKIASEKKRSYADVVRNQGGDCKQQNPSDNGQAKQIWKAKGNVTGWTGIDFNPAKEDWEWLEGTYVGTARSVEIVPIIQERFYMEGLFSVKLRAMGGKLVLLDGDDKDDLKDLMESAADWLKQWFDDIRPWTPNRVASERFVWLKVSGVPLHAWGPNFFNTIATLWGRFISLDESTSLKKRLDVARVLISTTDMGSISKVLHIKVNGEPFCIRCKEEEFSNGHFNLKSDHKPSSPSCSEEDDLEHWTSDSPFEVEFSDDNMRLRCNIDGEVGDEDDVAMSRIQNTKETLEKEEKKGGRLTKDIIVENKTTLETKGSQDPNVNEESEGEIADSQQAPENNKCDEMVNSATREREPGASCPTKNSFEVLGQGETQQQENEGKPKTDQIQTHSGQKEKVIVDEGPLNISPDGQTELQTTNPEKESADGKLCEMSFWQGFESESGSIKNWMGRNLRQSTRKRRNQKKKSRSCLSIYKSSPMLAEDGIKKQAGKLKSKNLRKEGLPSFLPDPEKPIAGESISDSAIANCNRSNSRRNLISEIWQFAQQVGMEALENEEEIIQQITNMESRDKEAKEKLKERRRASKLKKEVREVVRKERVEFLAIQESKMEVVDRATCKQLWGSDDFDFCMKASNGNSGGLLCIWDNKLLKNCSQIEGENFVGVSGNWGEKMLPVYLINVYAPCDAVVRRCMWDELKALIYGRSGNWCLMGDFNCTRKLNERAGANGASRGMRDFDNFVRETELVDLPLIGRKYTWYHPSGNSMSRLDRFLLSEGWLENWSEVKQWGLMRTVSDHCPIILKEQKPDWGPKPFKLFNNWVNHPDFTKVVSEVWKSTKPEGWKGYCLKEKLKATKNRIKEWSCKEFNLLELKIKEAKEGIEELDKRAEQTQLTDLEITTRKQLFYDLWDGLKIKEGMSRQKARKEWLRNGDANTQFFHKCIRNRQRKQEINCIEINGCHQNSVQGIKDGIAKHFEELYREEDWARPVLNGINFKQISTAQANLLTSPFSEEEIKKAVWDCGCSKAPGLDGFNFLFFRRMWEVIKKDVVDFVQEFHKNGRLVAGSNASFITLIPKVCNPQKIEDLVIPYVIGKQQMAFIEGRQLSEGVIIANEIIDDAKKRKRECFLFKIDFEKAFDKVSWRFLDYMLMRMGFGDIWRGWIRECLQTSMVSILVNGSPTRQFKVSKGLRQGDPLSPFLFLIIAEALNGIITKATELSLFEGVEVAQNGVHCSHIQFADDALIFGKASESNVWAAKCIMRTFELATGLKINYSKSQLMGVNVEEDWMEKMACLLNCKIGCMPFKYLGVPVGGNHRRMELWKPLIDTFSKKLTTWKGQQLSLGGRITLLNSVLSSLPVFLLSVYLAPKVAAKDQMLQSLDSVKLQQGVKDNWDWIHTKDGAYTAKSGYQHLASLQNSNHRHEFSRVWNSYIPTKICGFVWQLLLNKIPTKANLFKRGVISQTQELICCFCNEHVEDRDHLFLKCRIVDEIWNKCFKWWNLQKTNFENCWEAFVKHAESPPHAKRKKGWEAIWFSVTWTVWLTRNRKLFQKEEVDTARIYHSIKEGCEKAEEYKHAANSWKVPEMQLRKLRAKNINKGGYGILEGLSIVKSDTVVVPTLYYGVDTKRKNGPKSPTRTWCRHTI
ncbi:hypothetical protein SLEP1_g23173 [Rubroshorea leprosula]|uniref:Uncharacterized protein n=1 Tax=Rubroshorea leprosula TaxID=152421 RepID=A0AAV5JBI2_9ROSI|nr:hypothetical protein SLEP1_g23173 [Rubroshorea leprosula]